MAGYDMKFRPKWDFAPNITEEDTLPKPNRMFDYHLPPHLLRDMRQAKEPSFLKSLGQGLKITGNALKQPFRPDTQGMPQSLYDLVMNKKVSFNLGGKGNFLNFKLPESHKKFEKGESNLGIDFQYNF
jgi:hypothetical protein